MIIWFKIHTVEVETSHLSKYRYRQVQIHVLGIKVYALVRSIQHGQHKTCKLESILF